MEVEFTSVSVLQFLEEIHSHYLVTENYPYEGILLQLALKKSCQACNC